MDKIRCHRAFSTILSFIFQRANNFSIEMATDRGISGEGLRGSGKGPQLSALMSQKKSEKSPLL